MQTQTNQTVKKPVSGQKIRVAKNCPVCGYRILDKVGTGGCEIAIKCPRCKNVVSINLAFRIAT